VSESTHHGESEPEVGAVRFDPGTGLVPAVVQDADDGRVLMLGYMNRDALERTIETGRVTFWSRSRGELWEKGETSGHTLELRRVRTDCDGDALLVEAVRHGPTCHTGKRSCFEAGETLEERPAGARGEPGGPGPDGGAGGGADGAPRTGGRSLGDVLADLGRVIVDRDRVRPEGSYTAELLAGGRELPARKVGEEAVEVLTAALAETDARLAEESADLLYHLLVLWRAAGLEPGAIAEVLERRAGGGGP